MALCEKSRTRLFNDYVLLLRIWMAGRCRRDGTTALEERGLNQVHFESCRTSFIREGFATQANTLHDSAAENRGSSAGSMGKSAATAEEGGIGKVQPDVGKKKRATDFPALFNCFVERVVFSRE